MENHSAHLLRRLNPWCARALASAAALCQTRAHANVTPEHWVLKLLEQGEGDLTVLARRYHWDLDAIWRTLLDYLDSLPRSLSQRPSLSPTLLNLIQAAWLVASLQDNAGSVRGVHLLQALMAQPGLVNCAGLWPLLSVTPTQLAQLRPVLDTQSEEHTEPAAVTFAGADAPPLDAPWRDDDDTRTARLALLDRFTHDLTARARENRIDPIFGRDTEIRQMIDILSRRRKNNPILVGEPGVGKTALVEGLALRIASGDVPDSLKTVIVRTLDLGLLQAGAGVKGEFEQRLKNIIAAVQQSPQPILLFIDEAHTIIGAGNQQGGADAANLLKPALARGELRTIAATTWSEYKQYFERDAALERRFQRVFVGEPDDATACLMLRGLKTHYASYHGVHVQDAAVSAAVSLSRRYITGRQLPDKGIDLLDTACARVRMSLDTLPEALVAINTAQAALETEQAAITQDMIMSGANHRERLTAIAQHQATLRERCAALHQQYQQEKALAEQIIALRQQGGEAQTLQTLMQTLAAVQQQQPLLSLDVDVRTVATVIADWTGVPISSLLKDEQAGLLTLEQSLGERVKGQTQALTALAQRLRAARTGLTAENAPQGVFLLAGPAGTGKTETALALADVLFGGKDSLITINLSEYQEAHTVSQLKGSPPGYIGYGQGGLLTEAVRRRPYSVVLLDEVEKAHRDVINLFYQVFDRGVMRDGEGREIDFRNTVILMTSNLGSDPLMQLLEAQPDAPESSLHELLRPLLRDHFQPALLARFQTLIYRPLGTDTLKRIAGIKLDQVTQRLQRHYGIRLVTEESLTDTLAAACLLPDSGARNIDSLLNQQILPVLSQALLQQQACGDMPQSITLGASEAHGITLTFQPASARQ
ncbi:type VI secretion system ATPase TssH [Enterobacteriaceae bacterium LUAb1]